MILAIPKMNAKTIRRELNALLKDIDYELLKTYGDCHSELTSPDKKRVRRRLKYMYSCEYAESIYRIMLDSGVMLSVFYTKNGIKLGLNKV